MLRALTVVSFLGLIGCHGRYILGDQRDDADDDTSSPNDGGESSGSAGESAVPRGGSTGSAGSAGVSGGFGGTLGSAGASDAGSSGSDSEGGSANPPPIELSTTSLPLAKLEAEYLANFAATGGSGDYRFSLASGALPKGLRVEESGKLSGIPEEPGEFEFEVEVLDEAGLRAQASFELTVTRSRWLASMTFVASSSSRSLLYLVDLNDRATGPVLTESQSADVQGFSSDGSWLLYRSALSQTESQFYLVDTAGSAPSERQALLEGDPTSRCKWAPDSSKVACVKRASVDSESTLVYFDIGSSTIGSEIVIGPATGEPTFLSAEMLVYTDAAGEFARVSWDGANAREPEHLGVAGGTIAQLAPDGERALIQRTPVTTTTPAELALVNFRTGEATNLPAHWHFGLTTAFDAAVAYDAPAADEPGFGRYNYYFISDTVVTHVTERAAPEYPISSTLFRLSQHAIAQAFDDRVVLITVEGTRVVEQAIPGDYEHLYDMEIDPGGRWLYFGTAERDDTRQLLASSARHWLSRIEDAVPQPPELVGEGYLAANAQFSPNGRRLVLYGESPSSELPVAFRLLDLSQPEEIRSRELAIPLNWAMAGWSRDSSYVFFIGGSPVTKTRPLLVVDALAPAELPRLIFECASNPAPLPGCPGAVAFQP